MFSTSSDQHPSGYNLGPQPGDQKSHGGHDPPKDHNPHAGDQRPHGGDGGFGPPKYQEKDAYHEKERDHEDNRQKGRQSPDHSGGDHRPQRKEGDSTDGGCRSSKERRHHDRRGSGSGSDSDDDGHHGKHGHSHGHCRGRGHGHGHGRGGWH